MRREGTQIAYDDFCRRFSIRAPNLMWFLGAGASASAGVPTAGDMIWDFKRRLFISQRGAEPHEVADLSNSLVRQKLQQHISSLSGMPQPGDDDEYSVLFETVFPSESDRRTYLQQQVSWAKPSYGHLALATLMKGGLARIVWETNFDPLVADACARVLGSTGSLTTGDLDAPDRALEAIQEGRWPVEVKLHGDFRSRHLKNISDELQSQDAKLGRTLIDSCRQFGLVVVGYSGRDDSVMRCLEEAVDEPSSFPAGLFWLLRTDDVPHPRVVDLLDRAAGKRIEAALVAVENFDEILRDLIRTTDVPDVAELDAFAQERPIRSPAPVIRGNTGNPVIRLNALPVVVAPTACRRVVCGIGGTADVREAVRRSGLDVIAARTRYGVLAFGADADIEKVFAGYGIEEFDTYTLDNGRLRFDSTEQGLLKEALTKALVSRGDLVATRRGRTDLLAPKDPGNVEWSDLKRVVGTLEGVLDGHSGLRWKEGVGVRLDWASDRLWMLFEPRVVFDGVDYSNRTAAALFGRRRTARRYNQSLDQLLQVWSVRLAKGGEPLRALAIGDGMDAVFRLGTRSGASRRAGP